MPGGEAPSQRTRLAPSPTGLLHLGHVAHALWVWETARRFDARVILRIEDHDRGRSRRGYERQMLDDIAWLGFTPGPESLASLRSGAPSPWRQSDCEPVYQEALARLVADGLVYGCTCSRSTIARELGDGLVESGELRYPGTCRDRGIAPGPGVGLRLRLPDVEVAFEDLQLGVQRHRPQAQCGDLLIRDRNGNWTYQFCVTVDDFRHGVTLVVRGEDLLESTGRQILLARLLGRSDPPTFLHHPLLRNEAGKKLGKRDATLGLAALRQAGWTAAEVVQEAERRRGGGADRTGPD